jgi:hypothetical protein
MTRDLEAQIDDALAAILKPGKTAAMVVPDLADVWQRYAKAVKPIAGIRAHHTRLQNLDRVLSDPMKMLGGDSYAMFNAAFTNPEASLAEIVYGMQAMVSDLSSKEQTYKRLADGPWPGLWADFKQLGKRYRATLLAVAGHLRLLVNEVNQYLRRLEHFAFNEVNRS